MCMLAKDLPKSGIFCFNVFVKKKKLSFSGLQKNPSFAHLKVWP